MGLFPFFGIPRRVRRIAFLLFVAAAVYAGPRFLNDMVDAAKSEVTPTTVLDLPR